MNSCCSHFIENFNLIINNTLKEYVGSNYKLIEHQNIGTGKVSEMYVGGNISNISFTLDKKILDENNKQVDMLCFLNDGVEGIRKKNDLIVICPKNNKNRLRLTVFIIELKSDSSKGSGLQILCGYLFVKYLINIYKLHFDCDFEIDVEYIGILASSKFQNNRFVSTQKNKKYNFTKINKNGFEIPYLCWNPKNKLPLNDIHKSITCNLT